MNRKTKLCCLICMLLSVICFFSCSNTAPIVVTSFDYPELAQLEAGEFDADAVNDVVKNWDSYPYKEYSCYVSVDGGEVLISNGTNEVQSHVQMFNHGYFAGVDLGEFDGWVKYYPYNSAYLGETEGTLVAAENCGAIVERTPESGYLLTSDYGGILGDGGTGKAYELQYSTEEGKWTWQLIGALDGRPLNCFYAEEQDKLYVVTTKNIVAVTSKKQIEIVVESDLIPSIYPNSIVLFEGNLYCGSPFGVYRYNVSTGEEIWYPVDYAEIAGE